MKAIGWTVLSLVFAGEILAVAATAAWGAHAGGPGLAVGAAVAWVLAWTLFAAPRARLGSRIVTPAAKVVALGGPCLALWAAGHPRPAVALAVFGAVVNGLAQLPAIRSLPAPGSRPAAEQE